MKNIPSYDKYYIKNGKVIVTEYGYCPGCSVTDNPDEIYRIVQVDADSFEKSDVDGLEIALEESRQYIKDTTKQEYVEHLETLKQMSVVRSIYDLQDASDGEYISLTD